MFSRYWLRLLDRGENDSVDKTRDVLIQEATELMNIFGAIVRKSERMTCSTIAVLGF